MLTSAKTLALPNGLCERKSEEQSCELADWRIHIRNTLYPVICVAVISVRSIFPIVHPHSCLFRRVRLLNGLILNLTRVASLVHTFSDLWQTPGDRPKLWGPQQCNVLLLMIFFFSPISVCVWSWISALVIPAPRHWCETDWNWFSLIWKRNPFRGLFIHNSKIFCHTAEQWIDELELWSCFSGWLNFSLAKDRYNFFFFVIYWLNCKY